MNIEEKKQALDAAREAVRASKAYERLTKLFDDGSFHEIDAFAKSADGLAEVIAAHGTIDGLGVYAFAQNRDISGGAMSRAQAAKIRKTYDLALKTGEPVIAVYDSIGGRLDEGADLLAAYGDVLKYANQLSGVVPQISVILGKCFGTQALIASCADITVMSQQAELSLETNGSASSAEENAKKGIVHLLTKDEDEAIAKTRKLISVLPSNNLSNACIAYDSISAETDTLASMSAKDAALSVADQESAVILQSAFGQDALTALATVNGVTVGLIALDAQKLDGKSCAKAARFVRFCDAFSIPVITFVDAEKFVCLKNAAKLTSAYSEATTAKISVITGNAFGSVYIAAAGSGASCDMTYAWIGASVSALSPEAAAVIMLGDDFGGQLKGAKDPRAAREQLIRQFKEQELTAVKAAADGYIDDIIDAGETRTRLIASLDMLCNKRVSTLPKKHNNLTL